MREQRRFVRHLQAHWDTHRHRLPPQLAARIASLRQSGRLHVNAGRIDSVIAAGGAAAGFVAPARRRRSVDF